MKKLKTFLVLLICLAMMAGSLVACDSSSSKKSSKKDKKVEKEDDEDEDDDDEDDDDDDDEDEDDDDEDDDDDDDDKPSKPAKPSIDDDDDDPIIIDDDDDDDIRASDLSIDEQVLYDDGDIVITATGIVYDDWYGDKLEVLIENNSDVMVTFSCSYMLINNCVNDYIGLYEDVKAGGKTYATLSLNSDDMNEYYGIKNFGQIDLAFKGYDDNYNTVFQTDNITIKTNKFDKMDEATPFDGTVLVDEEGVYAVIKMGEVSDWSTELLVFVHNDTDKTVYLSTNSLTINGFEVDGYLSASVPAGAYGADTVWIYSDDLEESHIDEIETIEMSVKVMDYDNYKTLFTTDEVEIPVN